MPNSDRALPPSVRAVGDGFWNIRGSLRIGPLDIQTHTSLVRLEDGRHVFLDAYTLDEATRRWAESIVGDEGPAAILHLHPFHTLHVEPMAKMFPNAKQYGTARHHRRFSHLTWEPEHTESPELHARFADDFSFSVPRGVDFVPANENLHFASVLALHRATGALHVDDTLMVTELPGLLKRLKSEVVAFHPSLPAVLEKRAGAVADFDAWAEELLELCRDTTTICAAHSAVLEVPGGALADRVKTALRLIRPVLALHARRFAG